MAEVAQEVGGRAAAARVAAVAAAVGLAAMWVVAAEAGASVGHRRARLEAAQVTEMVAAAAAG